MKSILSVAIFSLAIAGCSSSAAIDSPTSTVNALPSSSDQPRDTNSFVYPLVGGGTYDLSRGTNAEPVALWFWAPG